MVNTKFVAWNFSVLFFTLYCSFGFEALTSKMFLQGNR